MTNKCMIAVIFFIAMLYGTLAAPAFMPLPLLRLQRSLEAADAVLIDRPHLHFEKMPLPLLKRRDSLQAEKVTIERAEECDGNSLGLHDCLLSSGPATWKLG